MASEQPILFLWSFSPWASKIVAYLTLRGIPHARCEQPVVLPRPDLAALGVNYRRIPVLAIGRDIYCDSLLILEKLESLYPSSSSSSSATTNGEVKVGKQEKYKSISAQSPTDIALERLLEKWTDVVVFKPAAACIPSELDLMKDPQFQKDREELWGRPWTKIEQDALRPAGLADLRANFDFLEDVLGDGRKWILGGKDEEEEGPKLADIHACWIFDWLFQINAFDDNFFSPQTYPRTFAWRDRYSSAIAAAKKSSPQPTELHGPDAVTQILKAGFQDSKLEVQPDPLGLKDGDEVEVYPIDTGHTRRDVGKLIGLNAKEVVIRTTSLQDGREIRLHFPRWNFSLGKAVPDEESGRKAQDGIEVS